MTLILVQLDDSLSSCLSSWLDLFAYANRLCVRRGGSALFLAHLWNPADSRPPADVVLLPARITRAVDETLLAPSTPKLLQDLRDWYAEKALVGAVCGGVFCLAEAGLLDGREATTHWSLAASFQTQFPQVSLKIDALILESDDLVLGGGMTAYFDLGLRIVRRFAGDEVAADCASLFVLDPQRRHQSPFMPVGTEVTSDPTLVRALRWAMDQPTLDWGVTQWAEAVILERRTFERKALRIWGIGPAEKLRRLKIDRARLLLTGSLMTWDEISRHCGFRDAGAFRRLFLEKLGQTPGEYRRRFGSARHQG